MAEGVRKKRDPFAGLPVLLRVRHGSHLYGTAHAGSDEDLYEVVPSLRSGNPFTSRYGSSEQLILGSRDTVRKDLGTWVRECQAGVPQALEAAWARPEMTEVDLLGPLRLGMRAGTGAWARHRRAMRNFACAYWSGGGASAPDEYAMKRARHAVRLSRSLALLRRDGRYDPTMTEAEAERCRRVAANLGPGHELWELCDTIALATGWTKDGEDGGR